MGGAAALGQRSRGCVGDLALHVVTVTNLRPENFSAALGVGFNAGEPSGSCGRGARLSNRQPLMMLA